MNQVTIEFTPEAKARLARLEALPRNLLVAIARGLDDQNRLTVSYIQRTYLSFPKDGPTVLNGLRAVSQLLRTSVRPSKATVTGDTVTSSIGSNVKYAAVHEYGGRFTIRRKPGIVRLKTDRKGNLLRQGANGKLAVFARKRAKLAKEVQHQGSTYEVIYPERMPIRRGIFDQAGEYSRVISAEIMKEVEA